MATSAITGRYALYKAGTEEIVRWLTNTAKQVGQVKNHDPLQRITARYLTACTTLISQDATLVDVPPKIIELLSDVITGRRYCADWYASQAGHQSESEDSNRSHRYFIEVLQDIYDALKDVRRRQRATKPARKPKTGSSHESRPTEEDAKQSIATMFAQLELEEPSEHALGEAPQTLAADISGPTILLGGDGKDKKAEAEFALWCHLKDLSDMREYVIETWREYTRGEVSYMLACAVTNTAIGCMRRADKALFEGKDFVDYGEALVTMIQQPAKMLSETPSKHGSEQKLIGRKGTELLNVDAILMVAHFDRLWAAMDQRIANGNTQTAAAEEAPHGPGEATRPLNSEDAEKNEGPTFIQWCQKEHPYHRFAPLLMLHVPALRKIHVRLKSENIKRLDEFIAGLYDMREKSNGMSVWLISACQTYAELLEVLDYQRGSGLGDYECLTTKTQQRWQEYRHFMEGRRTTVGNENLLKCKRRIDNEVAISSSMRQPIYEYPDDYEADKLIGNWPVSFLRDFPPVAGVMALTHKQGLLAVGIRVANDCAFIRNMAHLYKAVKHYKLLTADWQDMDWFLDLHKKQTLVHDPGASADPMVLVNHFELALGIPASAIGGGGRKRDIGARELLRNQKSIHVASDFLHALLGREGEDQMLGFSRGEPIEAVLKVLHEQQSKEGAGQHRAKGRHIPEATGLELLQTYKALLISDEPELNFDHVGFWTVCCKLHEAMRKQLTVVLPGSSRKNDPETLFVWKLLLQAASFTTDSQPIINAPIARAAELLEKYIALYGDWFSKAALEQSSGHIPNHLRPFTAATNEDAAEAVSEVAANAGKEDASPWIPDIDGLIDTVEGTVPAPADLEETRVRAAYTASKKRGRRLLRTRR